MSRIIQSLIGAVTVFVLVMLYIVLTQKPEASEIPAIDIGIEHSHTGTLAITVTRSDGARLIEVTNKNAESYALSLPEDWRRGEVRGAKLAAVTAEKPSFGYVRWMLPAYATVDFTTGKPFARLTLHNPKGAPLSVDFTQVDLLQNTGTHDVYLLKDETVTVP
jgi:hypothetical protein